MKDKIKQYLARKGHEFTGTMRANGTYGNPDYFVGLIQQCFNDLQPQWVSVDDNIKPKIGEVVYGYGFSGENENDPEERDYDMADMTGNGIRFLGMCHGTVTHWKRCEPPRDGE